MLSQPSYIAYVACFTFVIGRELHGDERIEIFRAFGEKFIPAPVLRYQLIEEEAQRFGQRTESICTYFDS